MLPFELVSEKIKENSVHKQKQGFFNYWSSSNGDNGFKENMNEKISFPLNRKSVDTGRN